jgi:hypothetical protein
VEGRGECTGYSQEGHIQTSRKVHSCAAVELRFLLRRLSMCLRYHVQQKTVYVSSNHGLCCVLCTCAELPAEP